MNKTSPIIKKSLMILTWLIWKVRQAFTRFGTREPKRVCVLYICGMGDILCDTFFFEELRQKWPQAELSACFPAAFCELQENYFAFDTYIPHRGYWQTLIQLWKLRADLIIIPGWLLKNSILAIFSNAKAILGYINDLSFSNRLLNSFTLEAAGIAVHRYQQDMRQCHLSQRPAAIAAALDMPQFDPQALEPKRHQPAQDYAVFHAGARFEGRRWPEDRFAAVADWLLESGRVKKVYLIGDKDDIRINRRIRSFAKSKEIVDKAGKLSLQESYLLIAKARLFVGNDSGPMHIAALAGVPTLGLMGPSYPQISGPLGKQSRAAFHEFECSGCDQRGCNYKYRCIKAITIPEVQDIINEMWKEQ
ncbi:MAG: glycosyltransferase family 9 protein [Candidatus Cloacimonetes bacterium]|nr:glycosyltransferase family 9 protein [Candidatus Cloacimonadota bacterium]